MVNIPTTRNVQSTHLYPKLVNAVLSSFLSMFPELSLSKFLKHCCQSVTYFQRAPKSWKETVPWFCLSNIPIIKRTVSGLNGLQVPLERATCSSSAEMNPLLSLSTLEFHNIISLLRLRLSQSLSCLFTFEINTYFLKTSQRNCWFGIWFPCW